MPEPAGHGESQPPQCAVSLTTSRQTLLQHLNDAGHSSSLKQRCCLAPDRRFSTGAAMAAAATPSPAFRVARRVMPVANALARSSKRRPSTGLLLDGPPFE
jgi:hypothetical protein